MWSGLHDAGIVGWSKVGNPCEETENMEGFNSPPLPQTTGKQK